MISKESDGKHTGDSFGLFSKNKEKIKQKRATTTGIDHALRDTHHTQTLQVIRNKMNKEVKSNIRKLAEKFNHEIEYHKDIVVLKSEINKIDLWQTDKYGINISYNLNENIYDKLEVKIEDVYDIILTLLSRKENLEKFILKKGTLLTTEEWIKEEGKFAEEQLEELKRDLRYEQIEFRELGGNRYVAEYYNGLLIMTDDLCWAKSNVIPIQ